MSEQPQVSGGHLIYHEYRHGVAFSPFYLRMVELRETSLKFTREDRLARLMQLQAINRVSGTFCIQRATLL